MNASQSVTVQNAGGASDEGLVFAGFVDLGRGHLVEVFVRPTRNERERHTIIMQINGRGHKEGNQ